MGNDNHIIFQFCQRGAGRADQIMHHLADDVLDIGNAFTEIFVGNLGKGIQKRIGNTGKRGFNIFVFLSDAVDNFFEEHLIFQQEEVGIKNLGVFGAGFTEIFLLHRANLFTGSIQGGLEAIRFAADILGGNGVGRIIVAVIADKGMEDIGLADNNTFRDRDTPENLFYCIRHQSILDTF